MLVPVMTPVVVMMVMVAPMVVVPPVVAMVVMKARARVVALLDPAPAVPDRTADQPHVLRETFLRNGAGNRCAGQGLGAAAG
ncbi:hypothetical protein [Bradyrhizobium sp. LHD-71]|uniref:hypothetical protein n=1 Tax=Bradyrhizobium sp. LHD-71 TaxID=3072141 RepID=UPI0028100AEB|nr:hypothetical protein [Bradyrhizobium sp. LHD-71]MDQ8726183.1 hypothetical protein [Bradyrhizobium sp. LHD-71]